MMMVMIVMVMMVMMVIHVCVCGPHSSRIEVVLYLLRNGAMPSLNVQDASGRTALHYGATNALPEHVQVLLICGAVRSLRTNEGKVAAEEAKAKGRMETTSLLQTYRPLKDDREERMIFLDLKYLQHDLAAAMGTTTNIGNESVVDSLGSVVLGRGPSVAST